MIIEELDVTSYSIPTATPEADGTLCWDTTTMVLVQLKSEGKIGLGYTYAHSCLTSFISSSLSPVVVGANPMEIPKIHHRMFEHIRNFRNSGLALMALSAVDTALWDLKAKLLNTSVVNLIGGFRSEVPAYGSGGFVNYSMEQLEEQVTGWKEQGFSMVKIKIGKDSVKTLERVKAVRKWIGDGVELFVDANGAYDVKEAIRMAHQLSEYNVRWFEEPTLANDYDGHALIRAHAPARMEIALGEYASNLFEVQKMIRAKSADVYQVDVTRCGGISTFLKAADLCEASNLPLSAHTAPSLHASLGLCLPALRHIEYFFDHARIEEKIFSRSFDLRDGQVRLPGDVLGLGFSLEPEESAPYRKDHCHVAA